MAGITLQQLESTQRFELATSDGREVVTISHILDSLRCGAISPETPVWIGGYQGRAIEIAKSTIESADYYYLVGSPLERLIKSAAAPPAPHAPRAAAPRPAAPRPRGSRAKSSGEIANPFAEYVEAEAKKRAEEEANDAATRSRVLTALAIVVGIAILGGTIFFFTFPSSKTESDGPEEEQTKTEAPVEEERPTSDPAPAQNADPVDVENATPCRSEWKMPETSEDSDENVVDEEDGPYDDLYAETIEAAAEEATAEIEPDSPKRVVPLAYATTPFKPVGGRIARGYRGHDVEAIDTALHDALTDGNRTFPNDEDRRRFEDRKIRELRKKGVVGTVKLDSYVAFCLPPRSAAETREELKGVEFVDEYYDARAETLSLVGNRGEDEYGRFLSDMDCDSSYSGVYARASTDPLATEFGVVFRMVGAGTLNNPGSSKLQERWALSGVDSKFVEERSGRLAVCCVGKLAVLDRQIADEFGHAEKADVRGVKVAVMLNAVEFWIYDYLTGAVYAKYTANEAQHGVVKRLNDLSSGSKDVYAGDKDLNKDWPTVFAESKDKVEKWEIAPPTIAVPEDAPTLIDALQIAKDGESILIKTDAVVPLGEVKKKKGSDSDGITISKNVYIVGESGNPDEATIKFDPKQFIEIKGTVGFKGVSFMRDEDAKTPFVAPYVKASSGAAEFKFCIFDGGFREESFGVHVDGGKADFWKCAFCQFGKVGVLVENGGLAKFTYCEIGADNENGVTVLNKSRVKILRSLLFNNVRAFVAQQGGGGEVEESFLLENVHPWAISSGSSREVERFDNVVK